MEMIVKSARLEKQAVDAQELALINAQTLREFSAEEVYTFRLLACDNRVDRDNDAETAKIEDTGESDPTPEELAAIEAEELAAEAAEDAAPENNDEE